MKLKTEKYQALLWAGAAAGLAGLWKAALLGLGAFPFHADEAVVGLMARHILEGERPVFFYGQAYMGSLDAFLVAGGFGLFGAQVWVIRLVQGLLFLGTIIATVAFGKEFLGSALQGGLAGLLLAVPAVNLTLYTTASLGGYGEALLLGMLSLLAGLKAADRLAGRWLLAWGLVSGLGLWANGLSLVFSGPAGLAILAGLIGGRVGWRRAAGLLGAAGLGLAAGSFPLWIYLAQNGPAAVLGELFGGNVAVEGGSWLARAGSHLVNLVLLGSTALLGLRPPWDVRWLAQPLIAPVLVFWGAAGVYFVSKLRIASKERRAYAVLAGVILSLTAVFLATPFGVDPSGRYFTPVAIPLALAGAGMIRVWGRRRWLKAALLGVVLVFNGWGTLECALTNPPGITTQFNPETQVDMSQIGAVADFLRAEGEGRGYTNYWVAYPLAFLSGEELIFTPRLPYHLNFSYTSRDDRYPPYQDLLVGSRRAAYITTLHPELDRRIRLELERLEVSWSEKKIGDFQIFYHLSALVRPEQMGLIYSP